MRTSSPETVFNPEDILSDLPALPAGSKPYFINAQRAQLLDYITHLHRCFSTAPDASEIQGLWTERAEKFAAFDISAMVLDSSGNPLISTIIHERINAVARPEIFQAGGSITIPLFTKKSLSRAWINPVYFEDPVDSNFVCVYAAAYLQNPQPPQPRHIVLLVDVSASMAGVGIEAIHAALPRIFEELKAEDRVSLISFSDELIGIVRAEPKSSLSARFSGLVSALQPTGSTRLNDAILSTAALTDLPPGQTTVLVLTDGQDTGSQFRSSPDDVIKRLSQHSEGTPPTLLPMGLGTSYDYNFLKKLAASANTGVLDARDQEKLPELVHEIMDLFAEGLHLNVSIPGLTDEGSNFGIMNYNTRCESRSMRIPKTALVLPKTELCITLAKKEYRIASAQFVPATPEQISIAMRLRITQEARKIHDHPGPNTVEGYEEKMNAIEALLNSPINVPHLEDETRKALRVHLHALDKNRVELLFKTFLRSLRGIPTPEALDKAFRLATKEGKLSPRYPTHNAYLQELIGVFKEEINAPFTLSATPGGRLPIVGGAGLPLGGSMVPNTYNSIRMTSLPIPYSGPGISQSFGINPQHAFLGTGRSLYSTATTHTLWQPSTSSQRIASSNDEMPHDAAGMDVAIIPPPAIRWLQARGGWSAVARIPNAIPLMSSLPLAVSLPSNVNLPLLLLPQLPSQSDSRRVRLRIQLEEEDAREDEDDASATGEAAAKRPRR